jgi:hypothetical protein
MAAAYVITLGCSPSFTCREGGREGGGGEGLMEGREQGMEVKGEGQGEKGERRRRRACV